MPDAARRGCNASRIPGAARSARHIDHHFSRTLQRLDAIARFVLCKSLSSACAPLDHYARALQAAITSSIIAALSIQGDALFPSTLAPPQVRPSEVSVCGDADVCVQSRAQLAIMEELPSQPDIPAPELPHLPAAAAPEEEVRLMFVPSGTLWVLEQGCVYLLGSTACIDMVIEIY